MPAESCYRQERFSKSLRSCSLVADLDGLNVAAVPSCYRQRSSGYLYKQPDEGVVASAERELHQLVATASTTAYSRSSSKVDLLQQSAANC